MTSIQERTTIMTSFYGREDWLVDFVREPETTFNNLLFGRSSIDVYPNIPDAFYMLFSNKSPKDATLQLLGSTILSWLELKHQTFSPVDDKHTIHTEIRQTIEAICNIFEIITVLQIKNVALQLRQQFDIWYEWVSSIRPIVPSKDPRAHYLTMLSMTQSILQHEELPDLVPLWNKLYFGEDRTLSGRYIVIGSVGLRESFSLKK